MKHTRLLALVSTLLVALPSMVFAEGAGIEWETLKQEVMQLYGEGRYDRAVVLAQKAVQVAEENVGPDHPDVATSLENLAAVYRSTNRNAEAELMEQRAATIRAIKR